MSDTIKPYLLSVVTDEGETACSGHDTDTEAHDYGLFLVNHRGCTGFVVERARSNGLSPAIICEVYP